MTDRPGSAPGLLQRDYGGFNPRFLGISIFYDSLEGYQAVIDYAKEDSPRTAADLHEISLRSVVDHEGRHYIDFLLSPYSTAIFRHRLQALVNGINAVSFLKGLPGDVVPVPLGRWARADTRQREAFEAEWRDIFGAPMAAIEIPHLTDEQLGAPISAGVKDITDLPRGDQFAAMLELAIRGYEGIDELTQGFGADAALPNLQPAYLHEASALAVQLDAIRHGQGIAEMGEFVRFLGSSDLPQTQIWRQVLMVALALEGLWSGEKDMAAAIRRVLSITVWAMSGSFESELRQACPARRFRTLMTGLENEGDRSWSGDIDDPESLGRMWDTWDRRLGLHPWRETMHQHLEAGKRAIRDYGTVAAEDDSPTARLALRAVEFTVRDQAMVVEAMLSDPRLLVVPEIYIDAPPGTLPRPDFRVRFRGFVLPADATSEDAVRFTMTSPEGETFASGFAAPMGPADRDRVGELEEKLEIEGVIELCDFVFSRLSVSIDAARYTRSMLEQLTGKRVLQLV